MPLSKYAKPNTNTYNYNQELQMNEFLALNDTQEVDIPLNK